MTAAIPNGEAAPFRLTVLNSGGRDPRRDFSDGAGSPNDPGHAPVNFHGYAACTGGVFHCETKAAIAEGKPVLLLLRGNFREARAALRQIQDAGLTTAVSLKETGLHQIAQQLAEPKRAATFREVVAAADGFLAATPEALPSCEGQFIPTPYPLEDAHWNFARPVDERRGIFIGTREWDVPSRHHVAALQMALALGGPVTLSEPHPRRLRKLWGSLGGDWARLQLLPRRLPYRDYLAEMARHRLVLQADKSAVPGQVAGDALLCRLPCVGGDGAIDRLGFPNTSGFGRSLGELAELAARLLRDDDFYAAAIAESQATAKERVSFSVVARALELFFQRIARRAS